MITTVNPHTSFDGYVNFSTSVNHRFVVSTTATTMQKALMFNFHPAIPALNLLLLHNDDISPVQSSAVPA